MMEFLAANFNLPTIIVGAIVFGGVGWITWHSRQAWRLQWMQRRLDSGCSGNCSSCGGAATEQSRRRRGAGQGFGLRPLCEPRVRVI